MTIATAIAATSPGLWWKCDEGGGSTLVNSGSLANNGTISGAVDLTVGGPEAGTTALRLFPTGLVTSNGMDITSPQPSTWSFMISMPANGPVSTVLYWAWVGNITDPAARGLSLYEYHTTAGSPAWVYRFGLAQTVNGIPTTNKDQWHHFLVTMDGTAANGLKSYLDGSLQQTFTVTTPVNAVNSDPLRLQSAQDIVLAHVCYWPRVLSTGEISSIALALPGWPYGGGGSGGGSAGGGGGLTDDQAAQLAAIDTKTDALPGITAAVSYISDTVNTINGFVQDTNDRVQALQSQMTEVLGGLDTILASVGSALEATVNDIGTFVQRVFQTGAGAFLSTPIGSLLAHPDPNLLSASSSTFVISGRGTCPSPGVLSYGNVFGIQWTATTTPIRAGYRSGVIDEYNQRLVQFVRYFLEPHTGTLYAGDIADFAFQNYTWFWDRPFPHQIDYDVLPGFELTCRWIFFTP